MNGQSSNSAHQTAVIILAGGSSSRLGKPKQLLQYQKVTLIKHAVKTALQTSVKSVFVVSGFLQEQLALELENEPVHLINNPLWQEGIGSSIRAGMNAIKQFEAEIDAVLILLCDQPLITAEHLNLLISRFYNDKRSMITATGYAGTRGVPAVFDKSIFPALETLPSKSGAQWLIKKYQDLITVVPFEGAAIDVDTEEDYQRLLNLSR